MSDDKKPVVNIPEVELPIKPLIKEEILEDIERRLGVIQSDFKDGLHLVARHPKSVTFFGSARFDENNKYYQQAKDLAFKLAIESFSVVTGGGPGIMEGANRGAYEAGGQSVGFSIELPHEQVTNPYVKDNVDFYYFFSRKVCLTFSAEAFVYFPGGFGTLDEFFEIITLIQTHKISPVPIILIGLDYWQPLDNFIKEILEEKYKTIYQENRKIYYITDNLDEAISLIKETPVRHF
ncbi:MAG: TIGR00730 family Rossman fold protein [Patescibacteria group bacterium]